MNDSRIVSFLVGALSKALLALLVVSVGSVLALPVFWLYYVFSTSEGSLASFWGFIAASVIGLVCICPCLVNSRSLGPSLLHIYARPISTIDDAWGRRGRGNQREAKLPSCQTSAVQKSRALVDIAVVAIVLSLSAGVIYGVFIPKSPKTIAMSFRPVGGSPLDNPSIGISPNRTDKPMRLGHGPLARRAE